MKWVVFLIFVLLSVVVYAECDFSGYINMTLDKVINGDKKDYNVSVKAMSNTSGQVEVKIRVNDLDTDDMELGDRYTYEDLVRIRIDEILYADKKVKICFEAGLSCINCGRCSTNSDCDNGNPCTVDYCDGDPLKCRHHLILWCKNDDGCCPEKCTPLQDNDCAQTTVSHQCEGDLDCDDGNLSTKDSCVSYKCDYSFVDCVSNDTFCPLGCNMTVDLDCDECSSPANCTKDACSRGICNGTPKRCSFKTQDGCDVKGSCLTVGSRVEHYYCNDGMREQKSGFKSCSNDYECESGNCKKGKCREGLLKDMVSWFGSLFRKD